MYIVGGAKRTSFEDIFLWIKHDGPFCPVLPLYALESRITKV